MKNLVIFLMVLIVFSCATDKKKEIVFPYSADDFITSIDGKPTQLFTLKNENGMLVTITNYGAKIVSVYAADKNGDFADVLLGFNSIADYQEYDSGQGAVVGPFANRISNASFEIDGEIYQLPVNNNKACLHSGPDSWYRKVWEATQEGNSIILTLDTPDGEYGFPGNKSAKVVYTLTENNEIKIDYELTTDKACHINLTNHSYFNLRGEGNGDILGHVLVINADNATPVDAELIPTGEIVDIRGTALDFTTPHPIGERIDVDEEQIQFGTGYDHNYVLNRTGEGLEFCASVYEPESGRYMEVFTTEPGVQLYTGNFLTGAFSGKSGNPYNFRTGLCLETQHYPDSPNKPQFPSTLVRPGDVYKTSTVYKFSVKE